METMTFECETVTPMFLAGADGRTPELRPPSIKGSMRFWWRAMNGHLPIGELKSRESEIFGSSDEKIGRSKFNIRILNKVPKTQKYHPLPHKRFKFNGIIPDQKVSIILSSQYDDIRKYADIFKISIILGGFGKRARRGFGGVKILSVDDQSYNSKCDLENIMELLNDIVDNKYEISGKKIVLKSNLNTRYPFLKEIQLGKEYDFCSELLKRIGDASHNHHNDSLGSEKKRLASPIYVSVLKNSDDEYIPIISTLNTAFEDGRKIDFKKQNEFKGAIL